MDGDHNSRDEDNDQRDENMSPNIVSETTEKARKTKLAKKGQNFHSKIVRCAPKYAWLCWVGVNFIRHA